ncbi:MAG TPA: hypothetical protein VGJ59_01560, partial [Jatrophihabitantaceae bacterium]
MPELKVAVQVLAPLPQLIEAPVTRPGPETETLSGNVPADPPLNVATTVFDASKVTVQVVAVPVQAPLQPVKVAPAVGVAVRVAVEPAAWFGLVQVVAPAPQLIPPPVTVPFPTTDTLRVKPVPPVVPPLKAAVTFFDWFIATVQVVAVPPQAPVQPVKVAPVAGVATSETVAPDAKFAEQMFAPAPQLIAPVPPLTLPLPLTVTVNSIVCVNVAVTLRTSSMVTVQVGVVPVHAPDQLVNLYPLAGLASSVTSEPAGWSAVHVAGPSQSIPPPVTRPLPETVRVSRLVDAAASIQVACAVSLLSSTTVQFAVLVVQSPVHL